jgi:leader peptidase (prepilin peptidase) / N-methyltransferase
VTAHAAQTLLAAFVVAVLIVVSWYDVRERIIPNRIVLPAWVVVLPAQVLLHPHYWAQWLAASLCAAGVFLVPALVYPAALGMGDVKLVGLIGAALGTSVLTGLVAGTVLAGVFAAVMLVRGGSTARHATLPYGPFLAAGAVAVLLL